MLKKIRNIIITLSGIALLLTPALVPAVANAAGTTLPLTGNACAGSGLDLSGTPDTTTCATGGQASSSITTILTNVINIFSVVVGVVAVIMIIVGGFRYIISGGESGNVSGAKNTIIFALIGLIVVALAQVIVRFVLSKVGNTG